MQILRRLLPSAILLALVAGPATAANDPPSLAELVAAGSLPKADERLPDSPEVITPLESIGKYGGTMRRALGGSNDHNSILRMVSPQGFTRWAPDFSKVVPNVAESWEVNADSSSFTFKLRQGMKWSDGQPFTADDVVFVVDDLLRNKEFYPNAPSRFVINGEPVSAEKIDDYTVTLRFAGPYGQFLQESATPLAQEPVLWAKHYCQQFHPKYNPDVAKMVDATPGVEDWPSLFRLRCGEVESPSRWGNPERPTLDPWIVTDQAYSAGATLVVMARNPYFWQVDTEGNQLPYVDTLTMKVMQDNEALLLEAVAGNIDMQARKIDNLANKPVLSDAMEKGGFEFFELDVASSNAMVFHPNLTHKDPVIREFLGKKAVRQALSLAIDRDEIIDIVYQGVGEPWQIGPKRSHGLFDERLATQFTELDTEQANSLLDEAGYSKRDDDGRRLYPDGRPIVFNINYTGIERPDWGDTLELVADHWTEIGIGVNSSSVERSIYYSRGEANDHDMMVWSAPGGLDPYLSPRNVLAVHPQASWFAIPWTRWYLSGGKDGEEPSESMKKRLQLFDTFKSTADAEEQARLFREIHSMAADEFEIFGVVSDANKFGVKAKNLKNVPAIMPGAWMYPNPGPTLPQQYFFE